MGYIGSAYMEYTLDTHGIQRVLIYGIHMEYVYMGSMEYTYMGYSYLGYSWDAWGTPTWDTCGMHTWNTHRKTLYHPGTYTIICVYILLLRQRQELLLRCPSQEPAMQQDRD